MKSRDRAISFSCAGSTLFGMLSLPESTGETAVVVVVGGPQYRAGSHRQFVLLSRSLAAQGFPVLRFDHRGMGDSEGEPRSFEAVGEDIRAAIDLVCAEVPTVKRVVLWGLCDGASAALLYCHERRDARVCGLALLNPWVRSETGLARTHIKHYYAQRLMQRAFWAKLLRGGVSPQAVGELGAKLRAVALQRSSAGTEASDYRRRMALAWRDGTRSLLLVLSGADYTAREFLDHVERDPAWHGALERPRLERHDLDGADHTFSNALAREQVARITLGWLAQWGVTAPAALEAA